MIVRDPRDTSDIREKDNINKEMSTKITINQDQLSQIMNYCLDADNLPTLKAELIKQVLLSLVAFSGFVIYAMPAYQYGIEVYGGNISNFLLVSFILCTCITSLAMLYNATDIFLTMRAADRVPKELNELLESPQTPVEQLREDVVIGLGSAASAVPLAALGLLYPISDLPEVAIAEAVVALVDNALLHMLPLKLALLEPLFRLPILPFELAYRYLRDCWLSVNEKEQRELAQSRLAHYQSLKGSLINSLTATQQAINLLGLDFHAPTFSSSPNDLFTGLQENSLDNNENLLDNDENLLDNNKEALKKLLVLIRFGNQLQPKIGVLEDHWRLTRLLENAWAKIDPYLQKLMYVAGAAWVDISCAGYLAAPIETLTLLTGSAVLGYALSASPVYFLGVLLTFFGGNSLRDTYNYVTKWDKNIVKIPTVFKLYPKVSALLILANIYLISFAYPAAAELEINSFADKKWDAIRPYLLWIAQTGVPFVASTVMLAFQQTIMEKFARHFGNEEAKSVMTLVALLDQLKNSFRLMKGDVFVNIFKDLNEELLEELHLSKVDLDAAAAYPKVEAKSPKAQPFYRTALQAFCPFYFQPVDSLVSTANDKDTVKNYGATQSRPLALSK